MPTRRKTAAPRRLDVGTDWEWVAPDTERLEVPGGWLYRTARKGLGLAVTFVPHSGAPSARVRAGRRSMTSEDILKKVEQLKAMLRQKGKPPDGGTTH
jgi:hypothetical protein